MVEYYTEQFQYTQWAQHKLIEVTLGLNPLPDTIHSLFSHLILAPEIWFERYHQQSSSGNPWGLVAPSELLLRSNAILERWKTEIARQSADELLKSFTFVDRKGETRKLVLEVVVQQLLYHSIYHRGQLAIDLRAHGIEVPPTDYLVYKQIQR
ncbi:MAG: hypothetical protein EBS07_10930 [Sphingobacteriia bacterium]|nr:hypothetical protein [Sphingobacteriia bacterium]